MRVNTPFSVVNEKGKPARFGDIPVGDVFALNGNVWSKRSSRTATGIWPACLPEWSYFKSSEIVAHEESE